MVAAGTDKQKLNDAGARDIRSSNILAATAVADAVRTSLGPKGIVLQRLFLAELDSESESAGKSQLSVTNCFF